jgi:YaiO family outer membrane protein
MLTGAVGKYAGNYWLSLRPYVRVHDGTATATTSLTARRYYEDAEHFIGAMLTYGESPTERITPDAVALNSLFAAAIHGSTPVTAALHATWSLSRDIEELSANSTRRSFTVTAGLRRRF